MGSDQHFYKSGSANQLSTALPEHLVVAAWMRRKRIHGHHKFPTDRRPRDVAPFVAASSPSRQRLGRGDWHRRLLGSGLEGRTSYETGWSVIPAFQGRGICRPSNCEGDRVGESREEASVPPRVPQRRQRGVERDLPKASDSLSWRNASSSSRRATSCAATSGGATSSRELGPYEQMRSGR
jgi:hypothetical protein